MRMIILPLIATAGAIAASTALAQVVPPPRPPTGGAVVAPTPGTTGNDVNVTVAPGPNGAATAQSDAAAASNAAHPSRAVPQGSGGR